MARTVGWDQHGFNDPAEALPLEPSKHRRLINHAMRLLLEHKEIVDWAQPIALSRDSKYYDARMWRVDAIPIHYNKSWQM